MQPRTIAPFAAAALVLCAWPALGAPRIESISARAGGAPLEMTLTVTIVRPTPLDIVRCEVALEPGDGSGALRLVYELGDRRSKSVKHTYKKAGSYRVQATGAGSRHCEGERQLEITVSPPAATEKKAAPPQCPSGWSLESESAQRFTCRRR